jgi:hypothetical protein
MGKDEPRQQALPEEARQQGGVPLRQGLPGAGRRLAAVGREQVEVRMPLDQISSAGDGDDDAGARVTTDSPADELARGLGGGPPQLREQLAPAAEERTQQAGDGQDKVAVRDLGEHLLAQPLGPQNLSLLLARRAKRPAAAREGHQHAAPALWAPQPGEAMLEQTTVQELPQDALHHRAQRPVRPGEAGRPDSQQLLQMPLDELE